MQEPRESTRHSGTHHSLSHCVREPEASPELPADQELPEGLYIVERLVAKRKKVVS